MPVVNHCHWIISSIIWGHCSMMDSRGQSFQSLLRCRCISRRYLQSSVTFTFFYLTTKQKWEVLRKEPPALQKSPSIFAELHAICRLENYQGKNSPKLEEVNWNISHGFNEFQSKPRSEMAHLKESKSSKHDLISATPWRRQFDYIAPFDCWALLGLTLWICLFWGHAVIHFNQHKTQ